jgi:hypothetical protein
VTDVPQLSPEEVAALAELGDVDLDHDHDEAIPPGQETPDLDLPDAVGGVEP